MELLKNIAIVGMGGFIGTVGRYLVGLAVGTPAKFPYATFIVNAAGCLLIGIFAGLSERWSAETGLLLMVGLCGGFTTFSAFALENIRLLQERDYLTFGLYAVGSVVIGISATVLGLLLTRG